MLHILYRRYYLYLVEKQKEEEEKRRKGNKGDDLGWSMQGMQDAFNELQDMM